MKNKYELRPHTQMFKLTQNLLQTEYLIDYVTDMSKKVGVDPARAFQISVCLAELLNNELEHNSYRLPNSNCAPGGALYSKFSSQGIYLKLESLGKKYQWPDWTQDNLTAESGRGLSIINQWADHVCYWHHQDTNHVLLSFVRFY